ncbi:MAG: UDP-N-acetylmuramoyl-L-alanyl-D-glutamate--2,6-diaminopimelate ligase MurE [Planctomycetota bacterium]
MPLPSISLRSIPGTVAFLGCGDLYADRFCSDSRRIQPGDVFIAVRGHSVDGGAFAASAVRSGATAIITEQPFSDLPVPQCIVRNARVTRAWIAMAQHGFPANRLRIAGITGTNGKTTTAWLLRALLKSAFYRTGLVGTIEYSDGLHARTAALTTPDPEDLAFLLQRMTACDATHCVMEISSHALHQHRCSPLRLAAAAITNITRDHLDYHGSHEAYFASKLQIAELLQPGTPLLLGTDDSGCQAASRLLAHVPQRTFGFAANCDYRVRVECSSAAGQTLLLQLEHGALEITTSLIGNHNALNLLAAAALAQQLQVSDSDIVRGLTEVSEIPGRMESISCGQSFSVFVDFAHTPDGLRQAIDALRPITSQRLIILFGARGDRDRDKRPLMAAAVESADLIFVTSDNPRSEAPAQIIEDICRGFSEESCVQKIADRESAIRSAIFAARPGDSILIAGRGHETIQQIQHRQIHFDDRRVAARILRELVQQGNHQ